MSVIGYCVDLIIVSTVCMIFKNNLTWYFWCVFSYNCLRFRFSLLQVLIFFLGSAGTLANKIHLTMYISINLSYYFALEFIYLFLLHLVLKYQSETAQVQASSKQAGSANVLSLMSKETGLLSDQAGVTEDEARKQVESRNTGPEETGRND